MTAVSGTRAGESVHAVVPAKVGMPPYASIINPFFLLAADGLAMILTACLALLAATLLCQTELGRLVFPLGPAVAEFAVTVLGILVHLAASGRYDRRMPFWNDARIVAFGSLGAAGAMLLLGLLSGNLLPRWPLIAALLGFPLAASGANRLVKTALARAGTWSLPVLLVADAGTASEAEAALRHDPTLGFDVVRRIDPMTATAYLSRSGLAALLERYGEPHLIIAADPQDEAQLRLIDAAIRACIPFGVIRRGHGFAGVACQHEIPLTQDAFLMSFQNGLARPMSRIVKAGIDVTLAAILIFWLSPFLLIIALFCRLDGGPVLFTQHRIGARGRSFRCFKFRTMVVDADRVLIDALATNAALADEWYLTRKLKADPRITAVGKFLRRTSLDELPQLFNVLRLEMSLVGPRPIVADEIALYGEHIAQYYATRPGLTGLWQVSGRSNTSYSRRVQLDVWYVNNWAVWRDLAVLLKTIPVVLVGRGAR